MGVEDEQQSILHPVHVLYGTGRPTCRHYHLLRQDPTRRPKGMKIIRLSDSVVDDFHGWLLIFYIR